VLGLLVQTCLVAYLVTLFRGAKIPRWGHRVARRLKRIRIKKRRPIFAAVRWVSRRITFVHPSTMSAWATLFGAYEMLVDIRLTDGAWVSGAVMSHSTIGADTSEPGTNPRSAGFRWRREGEEPPRLPSLECGRLSPFRSRRCS
jgi:hypothetical protein